MSDEKAYSEDHRKRASVWFQAFGDDLCRALEACEDGVTGPNDTSANEPGRFEQTPWRRDENSDAGGGGGVMSVMRGRVLEKAGVNVSTVWGEFSEEYRDKVPPKTPVSGPQACRWASIPARRWCRRRT